MKEKCCISALFDISYIFVQEREASISYAMVLGWGPAALPQRLWAGSIEVEGEIPTINE